MSEKRFNLSNPISHNPIPSWVSIIHDDIEHKHLNAEEICDLLNALHQENQQLKHYKLYEDNKRLQTIIADLKDENEKLRKELKEIKENPINYF